MPAYTYICIHTYILYIVKANNSNNNSNDDLARKLDRCRQQREAMIKPATPTWLWEWQPEGSHRGSKRGAEEEGNACSLKQSLVTCLHSIRSFFFFFFLEPLACLPPTAAAAEKWSSSSSCWTRWVAPFPSSSSCSNSSTVQ